MNEKEISKREDGWVEGWKKKKMSKCKDERMYG